MQRYRVLGQPILIPAGFVALTDEQAALRQHCLKKTLEAGVYEVMQPFQFKKGEVFGYDGDLPKTITMQLEDEGDFYEAESFPVPSQPSVVPPVPKMVSVQPPLPPDKPEDDRTVKGLAERLKLEIPETIELLKEYAFEAQDADTLIDDETYDLVLAEKSQEQE